MNGLRKWLRPHFTPRRQGAKKTWSIPERILEGIPKDFPEDSLPWTLTDVYLIRGIVFGNMVFNSCLMQTFIRYPEQLT